MEMKLGGYLSIEAEIPLLGIMECFMQWRANCHAQLKVIGLVDQKTKINWERICGSKVKLWQERENESEILFYGCLKKVDKVTRGNTEEVCLTVISGSYRLDISEASQSFQNVGRTYSEIARQVVEENEGQVICTEGKETQIGRPVIRYEETTWEFSKRMASHMKSCIIPDIESGRPAFWFGMPKGRQISTFSEEEYNICIENRIENGTSVYYEVKSREFYKIGDQTVLCGQALIITEVSGNYKHGEFAFTYRLKRKMKNEPMIYQNKFTGLGLRGKLVDIQKESVKIALDIDRGNTTGSYYYDWYPETGNSLYAMPEKGATVILYFGSMDEREAYAVHCLSGTTDKRKYTDRCLELKNKGALNLSAESLSLLRNCGDELALSEGAISLKTPKHMSIRAEDAVNLRAKEIYVESSGEMKIYQG